MRNQIFSVGDILPGIFWLIILAIISHYIKFYRAKKEHEHQYYLLNFYFKIFFVIAFSGVYAIMYNGGDTFAYYQGSEVLNNLFFDNPLNYLDEISKGKEIYYGNFNAQTGYPPGWIYRENESYFVSKIISILMFISFRSYWAMSFILAFIMANVNYKLYVYVAELKFMPGKLAAFALLFIPSVSFWCTGISKDTVVLIAILMGIVAAFKLVHKKASIFGFEGLFLLLSFYLLLEIRSFLLLAMLIPLFFAVSTHWINQLGEKPVLKMSLRLFILLIGLGGVSVYIFNSSNFGDLAPEKILQEAATIQRDFAQNSTYGSDRYQLNINDYSLFGMLKVAPEAIVAGIYRPFVWDSRNVALVINILEGILLLILTLQFFFKRELKARIQFIRSNEILVFSFFFVLIMAFMTGFSSSLYGVLVRLRAPLLPFAFLLLLAGIYGYYKNDKNGIDLLNAESE
ncbi:hypothetical protein SAMN05216474_1804 [Lishizhenia tianjinensis]|uniref:Dolichyl-phosphate-mannose-protein mannosyltransferase n=1 Tax=Lishizhenia tianjinensis TaxID=477690 RepID=A0A1I7A138_9FLAO|nr:hypothetical protein [Lishizhenia tianjinensis]SFT68640.1 hypothetical protein SAMN05216474_1804 [Lishizhenia tianjinensis]